MAEVQAQLLAQAEMSESRREARMHEHIDTCFDVHHVPYAAKLLYTI